MANAKDQLVLPLEIAAPTRPEQIGPSSVEYSEARNILTASARTVAMSRNTVATILKKVLTPNTPLLGPLDSRPKERAADTGSLQPSGMTAAATPDHQRCTGSEQRQRTQQEAV